jgi:hypothetical protein
VAGARGDDREGQQGTYRTYIHESSMLRQGK